MQIKIHKIIIIHNDKIIAQISGYFKMKYEKVYK